MKELSSIVQPSPVGLCGSHALVIGDAEFIGVSLVERLVSEFKARVRVMVPGYARAFQYARFPVEIARGNLSTPADIQRAIEACEIVFHFVEGYSSDTRRTRRPLLEDTKNLLGAAVGARVRRVVQVNTGTLYGTGPEGPVSEATRSHDLGTVCPEGQLERDQEALVYAAKLGVPMVVLQPTVVYGPYARIWTVDVLEKLRTGRVILVNGGDGVCNAVYVGDVVHAMLLAATSKNAVAESFFISGEEPVTWKDFYGKYEQMLGVSRTVNMSSGEAAAYSRKRTRKTPLLKEIVSILRENPQIHYRITATRELAPLVRAGKTLFPRRLERVTGTIRSNDNERRWHASSTAEGPIHPLDPPLVRFYETKTTICIDKAKQLLGYKPAYDFDYGTKITERWAAWANLLGEGNRNPVLG